MKIQQVVNTDDIPTIDPIARSKYNELFMLVKDLKPGQAIPVEFSNGVELNSVRTYVHKRFPGHIKTSSNGNVLYITLR